MNESHIWKLNHWWQKLSDDGNDAIGILIMDEQNWKMIAMVDGKEKERKGKEVI